MSTNHGLNFFVPIGLIDPVHLGRDLQRHAGLRRDLDRQIGPFFRGNPAEEREITAARGRLKRQQIARQPVMNRADPMRLAQISALVL